MSTRNAPQAAILLLITAAAAIVIALVIFNKPSSETAETEHAPPSDDGIGRQDYRGMTETVSPAAPEYGTFDQSGESVVRQNFRGVLPPGESSPAPKPKPVPPAFAAGAVGLVDRTIEVAVRNPEPVTNAFGRTFAKSDPCFPTTGVRIESLGTVGDSTLVRIKDFQEAPGQETEVTACPVGTVFLLPTERFQSFVTYANDRQRLLQEQLRKQQLEDMAVQRMLEDYNRKNR